MEDTYKPKILSLNSNNYQKLQAKGGTYVLEQTKSAYITLFHDGRADYDKLDGLVKELFLTGTDRIDLTLIIDQPTAKDQWDDLVRKYKDTRKQVVANKQKGIINFEKKEEQTVRDTWAALHKISNEILAIKPTLARAYSQ